MVQACRGCAHRLPAVRWVRGSPPRRGEALSSAVARALLGAMALVDFPAGSCVAAPNQGGSALSVVVQGKAVVYPPRGFTQPARHAPSRRCGGGTSSCLQTHPARIQAFAVTDTRILQISRG